ncbi:tumor-associated calcium signal transducer 2-like [Cheilinus undulatus]|uniref:tumor-associated calcium signal transducer 2-like n=1 Tax=Cheilinus undulatus TaxID=241271 RepID=UPI001BD50EF4|nr:tumor-associated calcium signal transducer 2-like [Cheilinus undulatus]
MWVVLVLAALAVGASATNCSCATMDWATCNENPCSCFLLVGDNDNQMLNCTTLIPKCIMRKAEIYRARTSVDFHALDNAGLFNPECENDGKFKAKQCKNTEECWCVNSAGSRQTVVEDENLKCEELVETL